MKYLRKFSDCSELKEAVLGGELESENVNLIDRNVIINAEPVLGKIIEYTINSNATSYTDGTIASSDYVPVGDFLSMIKHIIDDGDIAVFKVNNGDWQYLDAYTGFSSDWEYFKYHNEIKMSHFYIESTHYEREGLQVGNSWPTGTFYVRRYSYNCPLEEIVI